MPQGCAVMDAAIVPNAATILKCLEYRATSTNKTLQQVIDAARLTVEETREFALGLLSSLQRSEQG